jgi:hypothetical protein
MHVSEKLTQVYMRTAIDGSAYTLGVIRSYLSARFHSAAMPSESVAALHLVSQIRFGQSRGAGSRLTQKGLEQSRATSACIVYTRGPRRSPIISTCSFRIRHGPAELTWTIAIVAMPIAKSRTTPSWSAGIKAGTF